MRRWHKWQLCSTYGILLFLICTSGNAVEIYTNHFYVHIKHPGIENAHSIAKRHGFINRGSVLGSATDWHFVQPALSHARTKRSFTHYKKLNDDHDEQLDFTAAQSPTDPLYPYQWYLNNIGQANGKPRLDLNVEKAWVLGITGKNITTAIMDDGVDYMHPDLANNFNARASYDFSSNDPFPYPRYTDDWFNSHGTRYHLIVVLR
ncbi:unnamed protein product [Onchocerca flexuosa]|uniref:S8_pro-domain domain-containing protein n=1 Tax=Onchocerca flexuosa TaxID=387005 RepID=A0A183H8G8_9BILA|nr:unnamed protein product [Onchocerca flexuosa]